MNRREWIPLAAAGLLSGVAGFRGGRWDFARPHGLADVFRISGDADELASRIYEGIRASGVRVSGRRALIKAELRGGAVHSEVVHAIRAVLSKMNVGSVQVGDATWGTEVDGFGSAVLDLSGDDVRSVGDYYLPVAAADAGLVISVARLSAAAPATTNLAGLLAPAIYGSSPERGASLAAVFSNKLAVVDGIEKGVLIVGKDFGAVDAVCAQLI